MNVLVCHLGFEYGAHKVPKEREAQNPQNVDEVNTVEVGETSNSQAKVMSVLQNVPVSSKVIMSAEVQKDHELTVAEKDCVMKSSEEDMDELNAFVNEKLHFLTVKGLEQHVGDESVNVEEILSGNVAAVSSHIMRYEGTVGLEVDQGRIASVCPDLTPTANVERSGCELTFHELDKVDRVFREELGRSRVTSTHVKGLGPIYSKRRSSVLENMGHLVNP